MESRKYKLKADYTPEAWQEHLKKQREHNKRRKEEGKSYHKNKSDCTPEEWEQLMQRQRDCLERKKQESPEAWEERKERKNAARKKRYHEDPQYREQQLKRTREHKRRALTDREAAFKAYTTWAKNRELAFDLTREEAFPMFDRACEYCGRTPEQTGRLSGLDRVDSKKKFYRTGNVVPCCKQCNYAKLDSNVDDFHALVRMIYENHQAKQTIPAAAV